MTFGAPISAVQDTAEFRRIRDAPRRSWEDAPDLDDLTARLTAHLRTSRGTQTLRPVQAAVLRELHDVRGCFGAIRTGGGKTLVSLLAGTVLEAQRPLLLVPAKMVETTRARANHLAEHWRIRPLRILSYESLGLVAHADELERYQPDLIVMDESHRVKNTKAGRTRVVMQYLRKCAQKAREVAQHDPTRARGLVPAVLCMSGSVTSRTLRDYWHQLNWCLGSAMPLPHNPMELAAWCGAIDEKVSEGMRIAPGALMDLSPPEPNDGIGPIAARRRYSRRLLSTTGVIGSGGNMPLAGLVCSIARREPTPEIRAHVEKMRATWETPCGLPFETAMDLWRHERELSCDMYYRWRTQPPREWLTARKAWSAFVRAVLSSSRTLFTPMAVAKAIHEGLDDGGVLAAWQAVEGIFRPDTEAVWLGDGALKVAAEWLKREGGLCWVQHVAFGRALEQLTGVPFFQQEGRNSAGVVIEQHAGPAIVSIASCSEGFDLQGTLTTKAKHHKNHIVTCPTKNGPLEQLISRTHRDGQQEDDVTVEFAQTLEGDVKALEQARADAAYVEATLRQPQRLTVATWLE
jgi:hypothetical protein